MDNINVDNLLGLVNSICKKYDEIDKISGENFNIFQILNLENKELSHSKIIVELLDPNGSHGKRNEFLKLFLKAINEDIEEFENASVKTEKAMEDGRMDIFIAGNQKTIAIENKIYAGDQDKQIARYSKYATKIVYLTLDGREPSKYSTNGEENVKDKLILISYKDIINWLEQCIEKSVNFSYLRETIAQYINLLKYLTGQSRRKDMSDEIVEATIQNSASLESAFRISEAVTSEKIHIAIVKRFVTALEEFAKTKGLKLEQKNWGLGDCCKRNWHISFLNENLQANCIRIRFQFLWKDLQAFISGFCIVKEDGSELQEDEVSAIYKKENEHPLKDYIKNIRLANNLMTDEKWYLSYREMSCHKWPTEKILTDLVIIEKSTIMKECKEEIENLLLMINAYKPS